MHRQRFARLLLSTGLLTTLVLGGSVLQRSTVRASTLPFPTYITGHIDVTDTVTNVGRAPAVPDRTDTDHARADYRVDATDTCGPSNGVPSGPDWVNEFPDSGSVSDLVEPFRTDVTNFLAALQAAGLVLDRDIVIVSTLRPVERAYLMHYAYEIAHGMDPQTVPAMAGVDIAWVHYDQNCQPDLQASRQAAQQMVRAYDIVYEPALESNHTRGLAIDMTISWQDTITVMDAQNQPHVIPGPGTGAKSRDLWDVGASYGVKKLRRDAPHWSYNGH